MQTEHTRGKKGTGCSLFVASPISFSNSPLFHSKPSEVLFYLKYPLPPNGDFFKNYFSAYILLACLIFGLSSIANAKHLPG